MTLTPTSIPAAEPELIYAGQTLQWSRSLSDYPADTYTLKYYLSGPADVTLTAAAYNTTDHLISETAATTAAWTYGIYEWRCFAEITATGEKRFVDKGFITVKTTAGKSHAKTMLDAIEAILEGRATSKDLDLVAKGIGDVNIAKKPELLIQWRNVYRSEYSAEVANENRINGKSTNSKIRVRFRPAS